MVRTKVFVGNLAFSTKEAQLAKEFEVSGKVISANIITRGPRSLGYGFVELDSEADAQNAVKLLNKKEIDGRPINVEIAKPREEGEPEQSSPSNQSSRGGGRGGRGSRGGPRGGGGFRGSSRGGPRGGGGFEARSRPPKTFRQRSERSESKEEERDDRTPSKTTLFVANLPFSMTDDSFAKVFKDNSLAYKTAHVVQKRSGRSKGFGFAEFETEQDQQKALAALNNKQVEGRELVVKVALTENPTKPEQKEEGKKEEEEKKPEPKVAASPKTEQKK